MPSMDQYFKAVQSLKSQDVEKQKKGLTVLEGLSSDPAFEWKNVKAEKSSELITELCNLITTTSVEALCCRALNNLNLVIRLCELTNEQIQSCLKAIHSAVDKDRRFSITAEFEAVRVIESLLDTFPTAMASQSSGWFELIFLRTVHTSSKIRRLAMHIFLERKSFLQQDVNFVISYIPQLKNVVVPKMRELLDEKKNIDVLKLWGGIVHILGDLLHRGATLINCLLEVIEKAFKSTSNEMLQGAFEAWKEMVDNFSANPAVINTPKRLQLLLKPLLELIRIKNAEVIHAKILTWWYLADRLGPNLKDNFSLVLAPLFDFCFGKFSDQPSQNKSVASANAGKEGELKTVLISYGVQFVARLCEAEKNSAGEAARYFILSPLKRYMPPTTSLFASHHSLFMFAALKMSLVELPNESKLVHFIWRCLTNSAKVSTDDKLLKDYFRTVEMITDTEGINTKILFEIIEMASSLPATVLFSSNYSFSNNFNNANVAAMLLRHLLGKHVSEFISHKKFLGVFKQLTNYSSLTNINVLNVCHTPLQALEKSTTCIESKEMICKMWQLLANQLIATIERTQDVNQGDAMQHDFNCIHLALVFPFKQLPKWVFLSSLYKKTIWKIWDKLFLISVRCAALIPKVDCNIFSIELAVKLKLLFTHVRPLLLEVTENYLNALTKLLENITWTDVNLSSSSDFSPTRGFEPCSPLAWNKKKTKQLYIIAPMLALTVQIADVLVGFDETCMNTQQTFNKQNKAYSNGLMVLLLQSFEKLCSNLKGNDMVQVFLDISSVLSRVFGRSSVEGSLFAEPRVLNKLENVWSQITVTVASNYSGLYNNAMLHIVSPLLEATFQHPRKTVQSATWTFWHSTFAACYSKLHIPKRLQNLMEELKPTLFTSHLSQEIIDDNAFNDSPKIPLPGEILSEQSGRSSNQPTPGSKRKRTEQKSKSLSPSKSPPKARKGFRPSAASSQNDVNDKIDATNDTNQDKSIDWTILRKELSRKRSATDFDRPQDSRNLIESQKVIEETPASEILNSDSVIESSQRLPTTSNKINDREVTLDNSDDVFNMSDQISLTVVALETNEKDESQIPEKSTENDAQVSKLDNNVEVANASGVSSLNGSISPFERSNELRSLRMSSSESSLENTVENDTMQNGSFAVSPQLSSTAINVNNVSKGEENSLVVRSRRGSPATLSELANCSVDLEIIAVPDHLTISQETNTSSSPTRRKRKQKATEDVDNIRNGSKKRRVSRNILKDTSDFDSSLDDTKSKKNCTDADNADCNNGDAANVDEVSDVGDKSVEMKKLTNGGTDVSSEMIDEQTVPDLSVIPEACSKTESVVEVSEAIKTNKLEENNETITNLRDIQNIPPASPSRTMSVTPPSNSPNGILKKLNSNDSLHLSSPSNKRRVSFADPPVQGEVTLPTEKSPSRSPSARLIGRKTSIIHLSPKRISVIASTSILKDSSSQKELFEGNESEPIDEDLVDCKLPVSMLLPYLVDSINNRGFSQLLHSKAIATVGDLSKLTRAQIQALPIQKPKMKNTRQALEQFKASLAGIPLRSTNKLHSQINTTDNQTDLAESIEDITKFVEESCTVQKPVENTDLETIVLPDSSKPNVERNIKETVVIETSTQTNIETCETVTQTNEGPKLKAAKCQTIRFTLPESTTQTESPILRDSETQSVIDTLNTAVQTNPIPTLTNANTQTTAVFLNSIETDTTDLIIATDKVCQTQILTRDVHIQTARTLAVAATQTVRGIDWQSKENPFENMFKNFRSTLSEINDRQMEQLSIDHLHHFHENVLDLMNIFDRRWFKANGPKFSS